MYGPTFLLTWYPVHDPRGKNNLVLVLVGRRRDTVSQMVSRQLCAPSVKAKGKLEAAAGETFILWQRFLHRDRVGPKRRLRGIMALWTVWDVAYVITFTNRLSLVLDIRDWSVRSVKQ